MSFTIVEFEDKGVEYIPTRWLSGDSYCLCPPATKDFSSFRKILALPGKDWQRYKCVQLSTTSKECCAFQILDWTSFLMNSKIPCFYVNLYVRHCPYSLPFLFDYHVVAQLQVKKKWPVVAFRGRLMVIKG